VFDVLGIAWETLFKKLFDVVCGQPCLTLATACDCRGMLHAGATCSHVDATIIIDCGVLVVLLVPLLEALSTLHGILGGDIGQRSPDAT
jgi:hypothetical protein